jgi:signal transduction histidine kinase
VDGFATYAGRFAEEHLGAAGLRCRVRVQPGLERYELAAEARRHLYLAFKEAVNNAVKHARASEVQVGVTVERDTLRLTIADNGCGLAGPGDPTGSGLTNMRERMRAMGGLVTFQSPPAGGTLVVFELPLAPHPAA